MLKISIILSIMGVVAASNISPPAKLNTADVSLQLVSTAEMKRLLQQHPDAQLLNVEISQAANRVQGESKDVIKYTLGARVFGDRVVSEDSGYNSWSKAQDVTLKIAYPAAGSGIGSVITHVQINVSQSNTQGAAYVTAGGIGQRFINIIVEAKKTYWFDYTLLIFGTS